jgi:hypothetical protein
MAVDAAVLGELQLENQLKNIPIHKEDLNLASHKVENVQNLVNKQEWKAKHSARKHVTIVCHWDRDFCSIVYLFMLLLLLLSLLQELLAKVYEVVL